MYQIAYDIQDIVIRLPKDSVSKKALSDLLDYLQLESIKNRSALTENQAVSLAEEVDQQVWQNLKNRTGIKSWHPSVDTNILFSSLLRSESHFVQTLFKKDPSFFICELVFVELFKHKEKIIRFSQLPEEDVIRVLHLLMKRLNLFKEELIEEKHWQEAYELCQGIDENDTSHVALTLELNGLLWTGDKTLKKGLKAKGFDRFFDHTQEASV